MQRELMRMVADMLEDENEYKKFKKDVLTQHKNCISNKEYWNKSCFDNIFQYKLTDFDVQALWTQNPSKEDFENECTKSYRRYEKHWTSI